MGLFSFMETSFFFTLGITFLLMLLLVYHFKQRLITAETKQDTMFEIINGLVQEIQTIKGVISLANRPHTPYPHNVQTPFHMVNQTMTENNDEPDKESHDFDSDSSSEFDSDSDLEEDEDEDEENEKIIVSDNESQNDKVSVEELYIEEADTKTKESVEQVASVEKKPNFNRMNLDTLKSYILQQGWVEDASKMKKAQIISLINEHYA